MKKSSDSHSSLTKTVKLVSKHSNKLDVGSQSTLAKAFQAAVKQKAGTTVGCDWLAEISISFRKNTSTALSYPRWVQLTSNALSYSRWVELTSNTLSYSRWVELVCNVLSYSRWV